MTLFDQETEQILLTAQQRTIANLPAIAVKDLLASDIPFALKSYFRAHVERILEDELEQCRSSSRFNFIHPEVQSLQRQINSVLIVNYVFERKEFLDRLDDAVHLIINYLIRPQWTLKNFIFADNKTISSDRVTELLKYFAPYDYLKNLICMYVLQRHVRSFTESEFAATLWKLDGEYVRRKSAAELAAILSPVYNFMGHPLKTNDTALPVKGLSKFFEDKGLRTVTQCLEDVTARGVHTLTQHALEDVLEEIRKGAGNFVFEQPLPDQPLDLSSSSVKESTSDTESNHQIQPPQEPLVSIESLIDESDKKKFVKKIFRHSEPAFIDSLRTINNLDSWKQASVFIDEIFIRYGVDPYSNEAERLLEIVRRRFLSQSA